MFNSVNSYVYSHSCCVYFKCLEQLQQLKCCRNVAYYYVITLFVYFPDLPMPTSLPNFNLPPISGASLPGGLPPVSLPPLTAIPGLSG